MPTDDAATTYLDVPLTDDSLLPSPSATSQPFWDACRNGQLVVQRCGRCGQRMFPPQEFCPNDLGADLSWVPVAGTGTIYSFTVIWRPHSSAFVGPYVVAIVELDEGVEVMAGIIGCQLDHVRTGLRVRVAFRTFDNGFSLPYFSPLERPDPEHITGKTVAAS